MNAKKVISVLALAAGMVIGIGEAEAAIISTQKAVEPGVWSSDYDGALAYADKSNIPLLVFWANKGCSHCEAVEKEMNKEPFLEWMAQRKLLMVFVESDATVKKWIKKYAKTKISDFPYMAIYWPKNTYGETVLEGFSAYKGNMSLYGANSKDSNTKQIMDTVDVLLSDWNPGGTVTPVTPDPVVPDPVVPDPVYYTVNFVVDATKGTVTGNLSQQVESGKGAVAPAVVANEGWEFTGWDKAFNKVTANLTVNAKFSAKAVNPDPQPIERDEVSASVVFKKARTVSAIVYDEGESLVGSASLKLAKLSKRGDVKVTLAISLFAGAKASASFTATPNEYGDLEGVLPFKNSMGGAMECIIEYLDGEFSIEAGNDLYYVEIGDVKLGGAFNTTELSFSADLDMEFGAGWDTVVEPPSGEPVYVRNGTKFSFDKTPSIKYKKHKEDGETWYDLIGLDDDVKTNVNALKLSYKSATGVFSGSFKVYVSNEFYIEEGKAPKLKAVTLKVSGVVVNGAGFGVVKNGSKTVGSCTLE